MKAIEHWFGFFIDNFDQIWTFFNPFMTEAVIIEKPVHWFALQIPLHYSPCTQKKATKDQT